MPAISHRVRYAVRREAAGWSPKQAADRRVALLHAIRAAKLAISGTLYTMSGGPPIRSWQAEMKSPYIRDRRRAEQELAALGEIFPVSPWWKPRPSTPSDRRIAKQYSPEATPLLPFFMEAALKKIIEDRSYDDQSRWRSRLAIRSLRRLRGERVRPLHLPILRPSDDESRWSEELNAARSRSIAA
jgi:hypothetical protein